MAQQDVTAAGPARLHGLTGLRGVAALMVVGYHFGLPVIDGHFGVEIFFVLSGFVVTRSELLRGERQPFSAAGFLWRRLARILPALVVFVAVRLLLLHALGTRVRTEEFIGALTFTSNYVYIEASPPWAMVITWSLSIEMQFAVVLSVLFAAVGTGRDRYTRLARVAIAVVLASAIWRVVLSVGGASSARLRYGLDTRLDQLLFGALLAITLQAQQSGTLLRALRRRGVGAAAIAVFAASAALDAVHGDVYRYGVGMTLEMLMIGVMVMHLAQPSTGRAAIPGARIVHSRPMRWFGERSFSLYLYHALMYRLTLRWLPHPTAVQLIVAFALSVGVSALSYRWIEQAKPLAFIAADRTGRR